LTRLGRLINLDADILRGLEVVFAVFLVSVFLAWLKKQSSAAVAQTQVQPGQVLFDGGIAPKGEKVYGGRRLEFLSETVRDSVSSP
jgi:hypothetical protein